MSRDHSKVCLPSAHPCSSTYPHFPVRRRRLSPRSTSGAVSHALTYFNHVPLPSTALLAPPHRPKDPRAEFFHNTQRVAVGTLTVTALCLTALRTGSYIAGKYSLRRNVTDASTGLSRPIISFSTQYIPVMAAIADAFVLTAFLNSIHVAFMDPKLEHAMKHFLAAVSKAAICGQTIKDMMVLGDRCGAQGLLQANQLDVLLVRMQELSYVCRTDLLFGFSLRVMPVAPVLRKEIS